jgi:tetratricopeptide (TPR) repeat protein
MSLHVGGDPKGAAGVLDSYMDTVSDDNNNNNNNSIADFQRIFESSELALYKNMILSEMTAIDDDGGKDGLGGIRKALIHLDEIRDVVVDRTGWLMARVSYQLQLGMFDSAEETAMDLFRRGSTEDHRVHGAYMCALLKCDGNTCREVLERSRGTGTLATLRPLSEEERSILMHAYFGASAFNAATSNGEDGGDRQNITCNNNDSSEDGGGGVTGPGGLASIFPMSASIKRIRLTLLPPASEEFNLAIDKYCQRQIIKGVPSLGSDLSSLYLMKMQEKQPHQPGTNGCSSIEFIPSDGLTTTRYALAKDPVDVKCHAVYRLLVDLVDSYVASLSCNNTFPNDAAVGGLPHSPSTLLWAWYLRSILYEQAGEYSQGISLINKCIDHTPTAVDFYELKARLLESGGDIQQAADVVDAGRDLDHQDRYINNLATKTLLRAGREGEALKRISLFTRHEAPVEQNLYDMQCTWYELELADCLKKKGELGRSLRKYSKWSSRGLKRCIRRVQ